jgi:hypothetical protein
VLVLERINMEKGKRVNLWFTSEQAKLLDDIKIKKDWTGSEAVREGLKLLADKESITYGSIDAIKPSERRASVNISSAQAIPSGSGSGAYDTIPNEEVDALCTMIDYASKTLRRMGYDPAEAMATWRLNRSQHG